MMMAREVTSPILLPAENDAAMASPSVKLWAKSAARLSHPATAIGFSAGLAAGPCFLPAGFLQAGFLPGEGEPLLFLAPRLWLWAWLWWWACWARTNFSIKKKDRIPAMIHKPVLTSAAWSCLEWSSS